MFRIVIRHYKHLFELAAVVHFVSFAMTCDRHSICLSRLAFLFDNHLQVVFIEGKLPHLTDLSRNGDEAGAHTSLVKRIEPVLEVLDLMGVFKAPATGCIG